MTGKTFCCGNYSGILMESSPIVIRLPFAFPFADLTPTAPDVPLLLELALASFFGSFLFAFFPPKRPASSGTHASHLSAARYCQCPAADGCYDVVIGATFEAELPRAEINRTVPGYELTAFHTRWQMPAHLAELRPRPRCLSL